MKKLLSEETAQLCLESINDARPYLNRDVVITLANLAHDQSCSDPKRALEIAERALAASEIVDDELARAWAIWAKGVAYSFIHDFHEALPLYKEAEAIFTKQGELHPLTELQVGLVYVLKECGRPKSAQRLAKKVRPRCHNLGKDGLLSLGRLEMIVGSMYRQQGQLDRALQAYERAMEAYEQTGGALQIARIKINSANVYLQKDQYQRAETDYNQARELLQQVTPQPQELFLVDLNLGLLAERLGHYQKALHHLEQARSGFIAEARIASADMKRATIYNILNLHQESLTLAQSVTHYYKKTEQFINLAQALHTQAIAWQALGQLDKARARALEARELFADQNIRQEIVSIDLMLAELALENHDFEQARLLASRLTDMIDGDLWPNLTVQAYLLQARILLWASPQEENLRERALHHAYIALQQALHFIEQHPQPRIMVDIYHLLSQIYSIQGDPKAAWSALYQSMTYLEAMRANLLLDEFRIGFMDSLHVVYMDGLRLLQNALLFDSAPGSQTQWATMLYLLTMAATAPLVQLNTGADSDPVINRRLQDLQESWRWLQSKLKTAQSSVDITDTVRQDIADTHATLVQRERQIADLGHHLRIRNVWEGITMPLLPDQSGADHKPDDMLDTQFQEQSVHFCRDIQQKLATHETLLHYFVLDGQIYLLLVCHTEICYYPLGPVAPIDQFKRQWRIHIGGIEQFGNRLENVNKLAQRILSKPGRVLLEQPLAKLTNISHLYLAYPAEWHEIPFAALRTSQGYLVERFQLTHLSTPEALLQPSPLDHPSDIQPSSTDCQPHALIVGCSDNKKLPHNLLESHKIQQTLSQAGWQTTLLLEEDATRENFYKTASQSQLLHLATHAISQPENPLFSWILLDDGPLTVADIYHQTPFLNQALVVLSACQTGRGQIRGGGLLGMARAWLVSGARSLVASLWRVEDQATDQLMEYFYEQIEHSHTRITSHHLCQAQRRLAATRHPFFWAAFIYVGG